MTRPAREGDPMAKTKALLLAGGLGTRLRPITETTPKCLVEIAGRPLLDYWFDALREAGVKDVLINTHHLREAVQDFIDAKNAEGPFHVEEAYEPELLGSAGTIHANRDWADNADQVLIVYADNLSGVDLADLLAFHRGHDDPMTMMLFRHPNPSAAGIAQLDEHDRVVRFVEKPANPTSDLANAGLYVVDADAWRQIADMDAFDIGFDVLPRFVGRMRGWRYDGYHRDIGDLEALERARRDAPQIFASRERVR